MDIYIQNKLGFDVHAAIEEAEGEQLTIRLFPSRPTGKTRQTRYVRRIANDDHERFSFATEAKDDDIRWDFSALKMRVHLRKGTHDEDLLYELKVRNGHS
jgi:hypothetical protein